MASTPAVESLTGLAGAGIEVFEYALTELVNNAIEHSDARQVTIELRLRVEVKLYQSGRRFISRAAARRVVAGLERFEEVVLDFSGVEAVGQGFVDEVFRIWAGSHPETTLIPRNMSPEVAFMVERGLPDGAGGA